MTSEERKLQDAGTALTHRQRAVLTAVVEEHVSSMRPVGSKTVGQREELDVSSATIRNEMAELDERDYLYQPHTSAGRIPTQKAYRFYVNNLVASGRLSLDQLSWIHSQYRRVEPEPDEIMRLTAKVLADVVKHPAVAVEPSSAYRRLADISAKSVSAHAVAITCSYADGQQQFVVRCEEAVAAEQVKHLGRLLSDRLNGLSGADIGGEREIEARERGIPEALVQAVLGQLWVAGSRRVYVEGTSYILQEPEFQEPSRLHDVLKTLEQHQALQQLLSMASAERQVSVVIGSEHLMPQLEQCSTVMSVFRGPGDRYGFLGVLGPMRMAYREVIPVVDCVARQAEEAFASASR